MISSPDCNLHIAITHVRISLNSDCVIMRDTLIFLYFYQVSHCGVQCAFETRNRETTVLVISADPVTDQIEQM